MGTRSIIVATGTNYSGGPETARLYKHSDGYPSAALEVIRDAIKQGQEMNQAQATRFKEKEAKPVNTDSLVGLLIGAGVTVYGAGVRPDFDFVKSNPLSAEYNAAFEPKHLGNQEDLEWIYIVNTTEKTVSVYGGGYTGKAPQAAYARGPVDPMIYAMAMVKEYQARVGEEIMTLVEEIEALGFKITPAVAEPKLKAAPKKANAKPKASAKPKAKVDKPAVVSQSQVEQMLSDLVAEAMKRLQKGA